MTPKFKFLSLWTLNQYPKEFKEKIYLLEKKTHIQGAFWASIVPAILVDLWFIIDFFLEKNNLLLFFILRLIYNIYCFFTLFVFYKKQQDINDIIYFLSIGNAYLLITIICTMLFLVDDYYLYSSGLATVIVGCAIVMRWRIIFTVMLLPYILILFVIFYQVFDPIDFLDKLPMISAFISTIWCIAVLANIISFASKRSELIAIINLETLNKELDKKVVEKTQEIQEQKYIVERANQSLEEKNLLLEDNVKKLHGLAGSIAHEMRNPLSIIRQDLEICELDEINQRDNSDYFYLEIGLKKKFEFVINRGLAFINIILNNLKNHAIKEISKKPFSAEHCLNEAIKHYPFDKHEKESLHIEIETDFIIEGDFNLMSYVYVNLIKNSLYFFRGRKNNKLLIRLSKMDSHYQILVEDNGPGIDRKILETLFSNFATINKDGGTGLGLSFCKQAVEAFSGSIRCESIENTYTRFFLTFPEIYSKTV
jgi:signal transduction histidine kinase